jgi:oligopeptide/dipeptide ABC transporter ATP-binding protein
VRYNFNSQLVSISNLEKDKFKNFRRNCQMVFQDSFASLNPRHLVFDIVGRPLKVYNEVSGYDLVEKVVSLLNQVGLGREHLYRYPHQFSGGQRQRISIARALALNPEIIILDEPTSALDVSVQAQILNLLNELQKARNLAYLFVTHDLSVVRHMADSLVVMYLGKIAEAGETQAIFAKPYHPYTKALMDAKPSFDEGQNSKAKGLDGVVPDPARPPQGCRFHTRCSLATDKCGWEVDDVVRWLEDTPGMFESLTAVERKSEFSAVLSFSDESSAANLTQEMHSEKLPASMRKALKHVNINEKNVQIEFEPVEEILLREKDGRHAACIIEPKKVNQEA